MRVTYSVQTVSLRAIIYHIIMDLCLLPFITLMTFPLLIADIHVLIFESALSLWMWGFTIGYQEPHIDVILKAPHCAIILFLLKSFIQYYVDIYFVDVLLFGMLHSMIGYTLFQLLIELVKLISTIT